MLQERLLKTLVELGATRENVRVADSLATANVLIAREKFVLAFVDLSLPDGRGLGLIQRLRECSRDSHILVGSAWSSAEVLFEALSAGASGYVLKERDDIEMLLSIRSVLQGGAPIDPFIASRILELLPRAEEPDRSRPPAHPEEALSGREVEILRLVGEGMSNREIADQLNLSRYTVESHAKRIYRKLAVSSRMMAVHAARERGILE